jgi:hypothetical protein
MLIIDSKNWQINSMFSMMHPCLFIYLFINVKTKGERLFLKVWTKLQTPKKIILISVTN